MTRYELIETMARAMCSDPDECVHGSGWITDGGSGFECYIKAWEQKKPAVEMQLSAIEAAGLAIVPVEATPEMVHAALTQDAKGIWPAMIEAGRI